jgi:uncharacterized metal-binding protein
MSSGRVHTLSAVALATGFTVAALSDFDVSAMQYTYGALIGILVSPDCDVDKGNMGYYYIRKRLGDWAEYIWDKVWFMYRRSVKHGSELSHFPVVSTLGRLTYLFFFVLVIPYLFLDIFFPIDLGYEFSWWFGKLCQYWRIIVGLGSIDFVHFVLDIATVKGKFSLSSLLSLSPVPNRR